jgi:DNA (cytosine-5)-methyltransferase 1
LNPLVAKVSPFVSVFDAIDDLRNGSKCHSNYIIEISRIFKNVVSQKILSNHELRANNDTVKRRFRLYQLLNQVSNNSKINVLNFLASKVSTISNDVWFEFSSLKFYNNYGKNEGKKINKSNSLRNS